MGTYITLNFQGGLSTIGDIYEVGLETEKGIVERLQIFDTPGSVSPSLNMTQLQGGRRGIIIIIIIVLLIFRAVHVCIMLRVECL